MSYELKKREKDGSLLLGRLKGLAVAPSKPSCGCGRTGDFGMITVTLGWE